MDIVVKSYSQYGDKLAVSFNGGKEWEKQQLMELDRILLSGGILVRLESWHLEKIYLIINRTRTHHQVQTPASLRSGIALARLTGVAQKRNKKADSNKILRNLASNVLFGAIQAKPGVKAKDVIVNIISQDLGSA